MYVKSKLNETDYLFDLLNYCYSNIKLTLEQNHKKFLNTQIIKENNKINQSFCQVVGFGPF